MMMMMMYVLGEVQYSDTICTAGGCTVCMYWEKYRSEQRVVYICGIYVGLVLPPPALLSSSPFVPPSTKLSVLLLLRQTSVTPPCCRSQEDHVCRWQFPCSTVAMLACQ